MQPLKTYPLKKTWVKIKEFSSLSKPNFGDNIKATL